MKYSIALLKSDIRDELEKLYKLEKEFQGVQEKLSLDKLPPAFKLLHQQITEFLQTIDQIDSESQSD
jgi:hypothetical protein